ncbi:MAG: hypothetical protein AB1714_15735 [Acidobacteriota bacterium]
MQREAGRIMGLAGASSLVLALILSFGAGKGHAGDLQKFLDEIKSEGFQYNQGSLSFPDLIPMCCSCKLPSCWGNNASSTYGVYILPAAPGQTALNPLAESFSSAQQPNRSMCWRLRADEAIVLIGITPPKMKYFGFVSYLYDRAGTPPSETPCPLLPSMKKRSHEVFASLHDTINNMTIKCSGTAEDPFSKDTIIITTSDKQIASTVKAALLRAEYPAGIINIDVIPSEIVNLGIDQSDDSCTFAVRMATDDPTLPAIHAYIENPGTVWRLTPKKATPPNKLDPYPVPRLRVRGTGRTELDLLPVVEDLRRAILARYTPEYEPAELPTANLMEGYNCIQRNQDCLGDNRDAAYIGNSPQSKFLLGEDEFVIVYGVNHAAMGKASYSNFTVTGGDLLVGAASIRNDEFPGSAAYYLPHDSDVQDLYAWKIMRPGHCGNDPYCIEVEYDCSEGGIPEDQGMLVACRAYLEKSTMVGATYAELVLDRVIKFTPSTR